MTAVVGVLASYECWDGADYQAVRSRYLSALESVSGVLPVVLTGSTTGPRADLETAVRTVLDRFDGLVLTGHVSNVHPRRYGAVAPSGDLHDEPRDDFALAAVSIAAENGLPVLGLCRGLEEMNVAFGGTLRELPGSYGADGGNHREDLALPRDDQYLPRHPVALAAGGTLAGLTGASRVMVNSLHGQAIDVLAPRLRPEAVADDGIVEGASLAGAHPFFVGVQWHPEWYAATDPVSRPLFEAFGAAARRRRDESGGRRDDAVTAGSVPVVGVAR
jgi:putative glutamine amidotransferase